MRTVLQRKSCALCGCLGDEIVGRSGVEECDEGRVAQRDLDLHRVAEVDAGDGVEREVGARLGGALFNVLVVLHNAL